MDFPGPPPKAGSQIRHRISRLEAKHPTAAFITKCTLTAQLIMFTCMAAGEILYDANLFRGFLKRPEIWIYILLETAMASVPVCLTGFSILKSGSDFLSAKDETHFTKKAAIVWLSLGLIVIALYKIFYWPREWRLTAVAPGLIFGWILPCSLTLLCWSFFSKALHSSHARAEK
jgi:hypothetical protein